MTIILTNDTSGNMLRTQLQLFAKHNAFPVKCTVCTS